MNCKKVKYTSEAFANEDIKRITRISTRETIPIRAYLCYCGAWHLTSKDDKRKAPKEEIIELRKCIKRKNELIRKLRLQLEKHKTDKAV